MPRKFEIARTISNGKRAGHAEITTDFHGQSVTRHIVNGMGKHPDDSIPGLHNKLNERVTTQQRSIADKTEGIALLAEKKPKGWEELAARMQREILSLNVQLADSKSALAAVEKEDPLMVAYF